MAKIQEINRCVNELIQKHYGIQWTVRQMFYRLVSPPYQIIPITRSAYVGFDKQLVTLREQGEVSDGVFVDTARRTEGGDSYDWGEDDYFKRTINDIKDEAMFYTKSYWDTQEYNLMVVLEKDALSRLVKTATDPFKIPLAVGRGYSSRTQILQILDKMDDYEKKHKILYLGDFDPTGLDIERSLLERIRNETDWDIDSERIGLTFDQAKDLPPNPTKKADTRTSFYRNKYGDKCWELDALEPDVLIELVKKNIRKHIDSVKWNEVKHQEQATRQQLKEKFERAYKIVIKEFNLEDDNE